MTFWDLEERVEDALVAYLKSVLPGEIKVYAAFSADAVQYPCCVVAAETSGPIAEDAAFDIDRALEVSVMLGVEAVPEKSGAVTTKSARERNRTARSAVLSALARSDLLDLVKGCQGPNMVLSMVHFASTERSVDADKRLLVTTSTLEVVARPIETGEQ